MSQSNRIDKLKMINAASISSITVMYTDGCHDLQIDKNLFCEIIATSEAIERPQNEFHVWPVVINMVNGKKYRLQMNQHAFHFDDNYFLLDQKHWHALEKWLRS